MAFDVTLSVENGIAKVALKGELDAAAAPKFKTAVEQAAEAKAKKLVLMMDGLEYMASAGLRVLIFAKQKMGPSVGVFVVGARDAVVESIEMTGFHQSVTMLPSYDASLIEK
ncbi:MAG: STAS domain-containing protein [Deltaproteobacteria bacterium]|jgi:anti-anti-sigma factor|nr:STAS domain-containing protein [Deltaproteobacteria bacterium]